MKNIIALTRVLLKTGGTTSMNTKNKNNSKMKKGISGAGAAILLILCCAPLFFMIMSSARSMYRTFEAAGNIQSAYNMVVVSTLVVTLMISFSFVLSIFFLSSDVERLLPLPIKPREIVASKFIVVNIYSYLMTAMFYLPFIVGFALESKVTFAFVVNAIVGFFTLQITPVFYCSVFSLVLMRLLKNMKNKENFVTYLSFAVMMIFALGWSMFGAFNGASSSDPQMQNNVMAAMMSRFETIDKMMYIFPNALLMTKAFAQSSLLYTLAYLATDAVLIGLFLVIAEKLYFKGALGARDMSSSDKKLSQNKLDKLLTPKNPMRTYLIKERKMLMRSPDFFMNCALMPFIMPVFLLVIFALSFYMASKGDPQAAQQEAFALSPDTIGMIVFAGAFGYSVFVASMNMVTSTSISREGKGYFYMKYIPMDISQQIKAKMRLGFNISAISVLPVVIAASLVCVIAFKAPFELLITAMLVSVFTLIFINSLQMVADAFKPKLQWDSELAAIKQNAVPAIFIFVIYAVAVLIGLLGYLIYMITSGNFILFEIVSIVVLAAAALVTRHFACKFAAHRVSMLDE